MRQQAVDRARPGGRDLDRRQGPEHQRHATPTSRRRSTTIKKQYFTDTKTKKYDPKKYAAALKAQNTTDARVREQLRQKLLADKITAKLTKGITVTPAAITAYYTKNKSQFAVPAQRHVRHILVKTKAQADKLYAQLKTL